MKNLLKRTLGLVLALTLLDGALHGALGLLHRALHGTLGRLSGALALRHGTLHGALLHGLTLHRALHGLLSVRYGTLHGTLHRSLLGLHKGRLAVAGLEQVGFGLLNGRGGLGGFLHAGTLGHAAAAAAHGRSAFSGLGGFLLRLLGALHGIAHGSQLRVQGTAHAGGGVGALGKIILLGVGGVQRYAALLHLRAKLRGRVGEEIASDIAGLPGGIFRTERIVGTLLAAIVIAQCIALLILGCSTQGGESRICSTWYRQNGTGIEDIPSLYYTNNRETLQPLIYACPAVPKAFKSLSAGKIKGRGKL